MEDYSLEDEISLEDIKTKYMKNMEEYTPYILCPEENLEYLNTKPFFGKELEHIESYSEEGGQLTDVILKMDGQAYDGLPVENWTSVDCMQETAAIIGLGTYEQDDEHVKSLNIPENYKSIIPVSDFSGGCKPNGEFVVNTFSVADKNKGLGTPTAALGAQVVAAEKWWAVSQYDNPAAIIYSQLGDMKLEKTKVPGHSKPEKSYKFSVEPEKEVIADMLQNGFERTKAGILVGKDDGKKIEEIWESNKNYQIVGALEKDEELKLGLEEVK